MISAFVLLLQLATPARPGSGEPFLFATKHDVIMSWLEGTSLRFARYDGAKWSAPHTIVQSADLTVNWADFPSVIEDARGTLYGHFLQKDDIRITTSRDGGKSWSAPFVLNHDGKNGERGFVSLAPLPGGGAAAAWLAIGTLRYAKIGEAEQELDARTCECCATGMAMTSRGPIIVYRDRSDDEIRDIAYVRPGSKPQPLHDDHWKLNGCPVNGPQIDAIGDRYAVAWYTASGVYAQFTNGAPIRIDDGHPAGRVDIVMLDRDTAVVSWVEQNELRARKVTPSGRGPSVLVASATDRGFPRIAHLGRDVYFAWTADKQVRFSRVRF